MSPDWWQEAEPEIHSVVDGFTGKLLEKLSVQPAKIVSRKNPFLLRVRVAADASEYARMVIDSYLSSSEETMFGRALEDIALIVYRHARQGWKSSADKVDLEYMSNGTRCIVQIKSGPNWGNSSQKEAMKRAFDKAAKLLRQGDPHFHVKRIEGICYGRSGIKDRGTHYTYTGEAFWEEISGWGGTATAVIELLGTHASNGLDQARTAARQRNVEYLEQNNVALKGVMHWNALLELLSERV